MFKELFVIKKVIGFLIFFLNTRFFNICAFRVGLLLLADHHPNTFRKSQSKIAKYG